MRTRIQLKEVKDCKYCKSWSANLGCTNGERKIRWIEETKYCDSYNTTKKTKI